MRIRIGFEEEFGEYFKLLMLGKEELARIIEGTGWKLRKIYNSDNANYIALLHK